MAIPITAPETTAVSADTGDVATPVSNTAAVVTYVAVLNHSHYIDGIAWSYAGGNPTGGNLKIEDGAGVVFSMDITSAGAGFIPFSRPKYGTVGNAMTITLAAGGGGVTGKVSVINHWTE